ncbi:MAG: phage holin family protein [Candidatus Eremiobacteraeota bacterium]|nr:phage holin family protein [Candidatus Eremiobacteraeota bacterium]
MHLLVRLVLNAVALYLVAQFVPGVHLTDGIVGTLIAALILGIANAIVKPILIILSLPLEILTLGLFTFVINAVLFWFVGHLGLGLAVDGLWPALWGSIVLWLVSWALSALVSPARA